MVFYYTIRGGQCKNSHSHITLTSEDITCYVGRDKHENEYLIKYGWPGDIWFHVEGLSSAHVYFRLDCFGNTKNTSNTSSIKGLLGQIPIDDLPDESVEDMCQIVKHNSISGCKLASCKIVYTPHSNLKKTFGMESGAVTYHNPKLQRFRRCDKDRQRIKLLEKTKSSDLQIDYYEEMKANERRIIEWKRFLRKQGGGGSGVEIYDPVLDDLRGAKAKANRQGDESSGLDSGLAALEELGLGGGGAVQHQHDRDPTRSVAPSTGKTASGNDDDDDDSSFLPIWQREANARLEEHTDESVRFLLARGYTLQEIQGLEELETGEQVQPSVLLSRLWKRLASGTDQPGSRDGCEEDETDLWCRIYESRNEEKDVLEAIYGEDDLARFGWRNDNDESGNDDSDDDECDDPTRPFSFDCVLPVQGYEPPERYDFPPPLLLEVYVDRSLSYYPYGRSPSALDPPVLALVGGGLPQSYLREATDRLRASVEEDLGGSDADEGGTPRLFDWLQLAGELAAEVLEKEEADLAEKARLERVARAKRDREAAKQLREERAREQKEQQEKLAFRSEADRRAYAQGVLARGLATEGHGRSPGESGGKAGKNKTRNYDAGADNLSLVNDLFG